MKKKNVVAIVIAVIVVVLIIGAIAIYLAQGFTQELTIKNEIQQMDEMTNDVENVDIEAFNQKADTIVTTGDYAVVEQAVKTYLKESVNYTLEIKALLDDEQMANIVTADNYQTDGPDFVQTTQYLSDSKAKLEEAKTKFPEMFTEEKIMSYIDGKIDDEYYIDFYKEIAIGNEAELMPQEDLDTINSSLDTVINILNIEEEMINLLKDNKGTWTIEDGMIMFSSDSVLTTYNDLVTELQSVANILL